MSNYKGTNESGQSPVIYRKYELPAPEGPVAVKDYVLKEFKNVRYCFLRFTKCLPYALGDICLDIVELDAAGKEVRRTPVTYMEKHFSQVAVGEAFAPRCGVPVSDRCAGVQVVFRQVAAEPYVYHYRNDLATAEYIMQEQWTYPSEKKMKRLPAFHVFSKRPRRLRATWLLLLATLATLLTLCILPFFPNDDQPDSGQSQATANAGDFFTGTANAGGYSYTFDYNGEFTIGKSEDIPDSGEYFYGGAEGVIKPTTP